MWTTQQILDRQARSLGLEASTSRPAAPQYPSRRATSHPSRGQPQRPARAAAAAAAAPVLEKVVEPGPKERGGAAEDEEEEGEWEVEYPAGGGDWEEDWLEDEERERKKKTRKSLPVDMRCFDTALIHVKAGDGGKGVVAFRREKHVPRGGPSGGSGGAGGNVWAVGDPSLNSLQSFRRQVHFKATPGAPGGPNNRAGGNGGDAFVKVPLGTTVRRRDAEEGEPALAEILRAGQRALLVPGGRGGRGNGAFKTARSSAPALAEHGGRGAEGWLALELKLVADVALVGVPNAGKSTLLSVVSAARPKVADYPFTTLVPNLGVCEQDFRTTVFADIPGLLEGAHAGRGLGHEFLRHCQRARALVHVLDGSSRDPLGDYAALRTELALFNAELAAKPELVAYNKVDLPDSADYWEDVRDALAAQGVAPSGTELLSALLRRGRGAQIVRVSAATGEGVLGLVRAVHALQDALPPLDTAATVDAVNATAAPPRRRAGPAIDDYAVGPEPGRPRAWRVAGPAVEAFAASVNWDYYEAAARFQRVLEATGISKALREKGVAEGDTVLIGGLELGWSDDQSPAAVYGQWREGMRAQGRAVQGRSRWPNS